MTGAPENCASHYLERAKDYLYTLCAMKPHRQVGSRGNREATDYFSGLISGFGFSIESQPLAVLDYENNGAQLTCGTDSFEVLTNLYSLGCDVTSELIVVNTVDELEASDCTGKILLMKGPICAEQIMPKNFPFYNPEHHQQIVALLESKRPAAIVAATGRSVGTAGNQYPFPLFEDGDFDIPSVACKDVLGEDIAAYAGRVCRLRIDARRIPATACNVIARKVPRAARKIIVCAHIDTRYSTPGALDNASGVTVLLLLAEMLRDYCSELGIEIIAINGEDHYSAAGQLDYLSRYGNDLSNAVCAVNIDDAGDPADLTAYSFYEFPDALRKVAAAAFSHHVGLVEGEQWYQGDHMIFVQSGVPAAAFTSKTFLQILEGVAHTPDDTPDKIDCTKLVEIAFAIRDLVLGLSA